MANQEVFTLSIRLHTSHFSRLAFLYLLWNCYRIYDSFNHTTNETMCHSGNHDVNHAVVAVGLGTSEKTGKDYYIIRNSWSADWGEEGHFRILRGENLCGISDCASFPIVPTVKTNMQNEIFGNVQKERTKLRMSRN